MRSSVPFFLALRRSMPSSWHRRETAAFGRPVGTGAAFPRGHVGSRLAEKPESARKPLTGIESVEGDSLLERLDANHIPGPPRDPQERELVPEFFGSGLETNLSNTSHQVIWRLVR